MGTTLTEIERSPNTYKPFSHHVVLYALSCWEMSRSVYTRFAVIPRLQAHFYFLHVSHSLTSSERRATQHQFLARILTFVQGLRHSRVRRSPWDRLLHVLSRPFRPFYAFPIWRLGMDRGRAGSRAVVVIVRTIASIRVNIAEEL